MGTYPYNHPKLNEWQNPFKGVTYLHNESNILYGIIDDIWLDNETQKYNSIIIKALPKKIKLIMTKYGRDIEAIIILYILLNKNSLKCLKPVR